MDGGWYTRRREGTMGVPDYPYYESEDGRSPSTAGGHGLEVPWVRFCVCRYALELT